MWIGELICTQNIQLSRFQRVVCLEFWIFPVFIFRRCAGWWLAWLVDFPNVIWIPTKGPAELACGVAHLYLFIPKQSLFVNNLIHLRKCVKNKCKKVAPHSRPQPGTSRTSFHCRKISPVMQQSHSPETPCHSLAKRRCSTFYVLETMCLPSSDDRLKRRKFHLLYIEAQAQRRKLERLGKRNKKLGNFE